jgi:hypothetical protein
LLWIDSKAAETFLIKVNKLRFLDIQQMVERRYYRLLGSHFQHVELSINILSRLSCLLFVSPIRWLLFFFSQKEAFHFSGCNSPGNNRNEIS